MTDYKFFYMMIHIFNLYIVIVNIFYFIYTHMITSLEKYIASLKKQEGKAKEKAKSLSLLIQQKKNLLNKLKEKEKRKMKKK